LKGIGCVAVVIGGVAVLGVGGAVAAAIHAPSQKLQKAVDVQRKLGWSAGAFDEPLAWAGLPTTPTSRALLDQLVQTLKARRHAPFQVTTQLESIGAVPTMKLPGSTYVVKDLASELRVVKTSSMESDFKSGRTLARLFAGKNLGAAVFIDVFGTRSAAFAAGAASTFEPVLMLDNWPHPAGVVPAHQTLGAFAAYHAELTQAAAARGATPPPLFVLERERTDALTDPEYYFDNRYFVTLPSGAVLKQWGFSRALLIVQSTSDLPEAGDVAAAFADYKAQGMDVRVTGLDVFGWDGSYGTDVDTFFSHFPWGGTPLRAGLPLPTPYRDWVPGAPSTRIKPSAPPSGFGQVYVYEREGALVGIPAFGGSRDRSSGGYGG
jgi:hypothetical protein